MTEQQQRTADDLLFGGSGPAAWKFDAPGAYHEGIVVQKDTQPAREYNPNPQAPVVYKKYPGTDTVIEEIVLTLQTEERDPAKPGDTGLRRWFINSLDQKQKLAAAIKATGGKSIDLGGKVGVRFTHEEGANRKKIYDVTWAPAADVALSKPAPAPAVQSAPAAQAAAPVTQAAQPVDVTNLKTLAQAMFDQGVPIQESVKAQLRAAGVAVPGE